MSWKRFTAFQSAPNVKSYPTLPDHITYLRLVLGVLCGFYFSFREYQQVYSSSTYQMSGYVGIIVSLNFIIFIPIMFVNFYLNADLDSYKGRVNFAGCVNGVSFALFIWILFFTWIHEVEEGILNQALMKYVVDSSSSSSTSKVATTNTVLGGGGQLDGPIGSSTTILTNITDSTTIPMDTHEEF